MLIKNILQLTVVMAAGERHARNYHAWQHARQVSRLLFDDKIREDRVDEKKRGPHDFEMSQESLAVVHGWCLMHPRDISGWAFLAFWLRSAFNEAAGLREGQKIITKTKEFIKKYECAGDSMEWFLKTMGESYSL